MRSGVLALQNALCGVKSPFDCGLVTFVFLGLFGLFLLAFQLAPLRLVLLDRGDRVVCRIRCFVSAPRGVEVSNSSSWLPMAAAV